VDILQHVEPHASKALWYKTSAMAEDNNAAKRIQQWV